MLIKRIDKIKKILIAIVEKFGCKGEGMYGGLYYHVCDVSHHDFRKGG